MSLATVDVVYSATVHVVSLATVNVAVWLLCM